MSAQPVNPTTPPDHVNIEIDGKAMTAPKGSMIIHAADKAGVAIPRFCYHDKLSIAANCRMCLVEVEKSPKPMPACATPVMEGMKVQTRSPKALASQRNVMEFLLINHPLDCPICDQGGECELQDVSMGYGRSVSRFVEQKRSVADEDIGPLIATEMTRCIQCTRCVRFTAEVAGTYELGGMSRGENLEIGTYIGKSIESEIGGNIIDVCPVGALTNKPFRFQARAWELVARESLGYHDALGSNLWLHTRRGEVLRTVRRDNEAINECWLSDRDRYSHEGLYAKDRAQKPLIRKNGELVEASWDEAIAFVAAGLKRHAGAELGALVAPFASSEEGYLLSQLLRGLGSDNIDHRLRALDFSDAASGFGFEMPVAQIEKANTIVLMGCNLRHELPLVNQRVRKAAKRGAKVHALNPIAFDFNYELASEAALAPAALVDAALKLAKAASDDGHVVDSAELGALLSGVVADDAARALYRGLKDAGSAVLIFGEAAAMHPQASILRAASRYVCAKSGAKYNEIPLGANARGLARVGVLPEKGGHDAAQLLAQPHKALLVYQAGSQDTSDPSAFEKARTSADFFVYAGAYACEGVKRSAQAVLPLGLAPEIDGSYTNLDGIEQRAMAGAKLPGEARPGWKVLRALGAQLGLAGFDFTEFAEVQARVAALPRRAAASSGKLAARSAAKGLQRIATVSIYRADPVLRRAAALQAHPLTRSVGVDLHPEDAQSLGVAAGAMVKIAGPLGKATLPVRVNAQVPRGGAWIEMGFSAAAGVPVYGAEVVIGKD